MSRAGDRDVSRRDLAVARSLGPIRAQAEKHVQAILDAAIEVMNRSSGRDFTLQAVIEQAGQSASTFYTYFEGKHQLLLAIFEESVRATAGDIRDGIAAEADPLE